MFRSASRTRMIPVLLQSTAVRAGTFEGVKRFPLELNSAPGPCAGNTKVPAKVPCLLGKFLQSKLGLGYMCFVQ